MMTEEKNYKTYLEKIIVACTLIVLLSLTMYISQTGDKLQGTARVVNYTGIVRGATQRLVKLEIDDRERDDIIEYLDDIIYDLEFGSDITNIVKLDDETFQMNIYKVGSMWAELKEEIYIAREVGYENTNLINLSEEYFNQANITVSSAEEFSEKLVEKLNKLEYISEFLIIALIIYLLIQMANSMKLNAKNTELKKKAYTDLHTMLPNKSRCNELLNDITPISKPTAVIMFDINY